MHTIVSLETGMITFIMENKMQIEIGKTYEISCANKKSVYESEIFTDESGTRLRTETMWRNGEWLIKPSDEDEVETLQNAIVQEDTDWFEPQFFEENEMQECWDGCSFDVEILQFEGSDEDRDSLTESIEDEGIGYLFDNGFDSVDCEYMFYGPIVVEETTKEIW